MILYGFHMMCVQSVLHAGISDYDASHAHPYIHIYRRRHSRNRPGRALGATRLRRAAPSSSVVTSTSQRVDRPVESEEAKRDAIAAEAPPSPKRPPYEPNSRLPSRAWSSLTAHQYSSFICHRGEGPGRFDMVALSPPLLARRHLSWPF